jgi:hypothetical protein
VLCGECGAGGKGARSPDIIQPSVDFTFVLQRLARASGVRERTHRLIFTIVVVAVGILSTVGAWAFYGPMINNGDFLRVSTDHLPFMQPWKPLAACEPMVGGNALRSALPESTMSLFFDILVFAYRLGGQSCMSQSTIFLFLSAIYWSGVVALIVAAGVAFNSRVRGVVCCVVAYATLAYYFKSLYEEAAVLALMPWLVTGVALRATLPGAMLLASASALVLYAKSELILVLPVLVAAFAGSCVVQRQSRFRFAMLLVAFFVVPPAFQAGKATFTHLSQQNAYNRVFNGLGWAGEGVAFWPAGNYSERAHYFVHNKASLQAGDPAASDIQGADLAGTSFWPTGNDILTNGNAAQIAAVYAATSAGSYLRLVAHPATLGRLIDATYVVAETSDYSLAYIRPDAGSLDGPLAPMLGIQRHLWLIFSLICIASAALNRDAASTLCAVYFVVGCPLFVVLSDGFYEFEKHMLPFVMFFPFILCVRGEGAID